MGRRIWRRPSRMNYQAGYIVVFQSVPELLQRIRNTFSSENKESETQIMRALLECDTHFR